MGRIGVALVWVAVTASGAEAQTSLETARRIGREREATLHAVHFHDAKEGWVVGDEGVIRRTLDGGATWETQDTGTRASLRSVCFLDEAVGWAVGREERLGGGSVGVVLFTRDGGVRWSRVLENSLPGLNAVRFVDRNHGFLLGDGVEPYASGLFRTSDGGKSWEPVGGTRTASWYAGAFPDMRTGLLAGADGQVATLANGEWRALAPPASAGRSLRAVQVLRDRVSAVGDAGLVLTGDGVNWTPADVKLAPPALAALDLRALSAVGDQVWAVGRPGSVVLASRDAGRTWRTQRTGQPLPLHGVHFIDARHGWAVGTAGLVLATRDGGESWTRLTQASERAPVLAVSARAEEAALDALAHVGAAEGVHAVALAVGVGDPSAQDPTQARVASRLHQTAREVGGLAGETLARFPMPQWLDAAPAERVHAHWSKLHAGRSAEALTAQLVLALRVWRPDVVLADNPDAPGPTGLVASALAQAIAQAADTSAFPEQIESLGLAPWKATSLYGRAPRTGGTIRLDNTLPSTSLEKPVREFSYLPAATLTGDPFAIPKHAHYRPLAGRAGDALLDGANPGGSRREMPDAKPQPALAKAQQSARQIRDLVDAQPRSEAVFAQLVPLLAELPKSASAQALHAVALTYARRGEWEFARELYLSLVDRHPGHPLAVDGYRWLARHGASSEARRRHELRHFVAVRPEHVVDPRDLGRAKSDVVPASAVVGGAERSPFGRLAEARQWDLASLEAGKRLAPFGPLVSADPSVQFAIQSARRRAGQGALALDWFERFATVAGSGPWHEAAAAESRVGVEAKTGRRPAVCWRLDERPQLDGKLDDACWAAAAPFALVDASAETCDRFPTEARLAHDAEFLYLAVRCRHPRGRALPTLRDRTHDADLDAHDRVALLLDLDRDYATCFRFEVDQRGLVREDCWGDASWNPKWYVAVRAADDGWQLEAAIPLAELTSAPPAPDARWAVNVVRILPGLGVQSRSQPADVRPRPEGLSPLTFRRDPRRPSPTDAPKATP